MLAAGGGRVKLFKNMSDCEPRERPKKVNDEFSDLRDKIVKRSADLDYYIHHEAAFKPHEKKLENEIDELATKIFAHEKNIKELEEKIKNEEARHSQHKNNAAAQNTEELTEQISELEKKYKFLLEKKAKYMKKIPEYA